MSLVFQTDASVSLKGNRPGLYIGDKNDAKNRDKLRRWNVTHILNMTPAKQINIQAGVSNYFEADFIYKRVPILDNPTSASQLLTNADAIVNFIASGLCSGSVLVHCQRGVSRSTSAVVFYLISRGNMTFQEAVATIQRRRPEAQPIPAFVEVLKTYELRRMKQDEHQEKEPPKRKVVVANEQDLAMKRPRAIGPCLPPTSSDPIHDTGTITNTVTATESDSVASPSSLSLPGNA